MEIISDTEDIIHMQTPDFKFICKNDKLCLSMFDLDDTIICKKKDSEKKWCFNGELEKIKTMLEKLSKISSIIIITNQKGISMKKVKQSEFTEKIKSIQKELDIELLVLVSKRDNIYRKPNIGFIDYIYELSGKTQLYKRCFYCGDAAGRPGDFSDSDKRFAENLGIGFFLPENIFSVSE